MFIVPREFSDRLHSGGLRVGTLVVASIPPVGVVLLDEGVCKLVIGSLEVSSIASIDQCLDTHLDVVLDESTEGHEERRLLLRDCTYSHTPVRVDGHTTLKLAGRAVEEAGAARDSAQVSFGAGCAAALDNANLLLLGAKGSGYSVVTEWAAVTEEEECVAGPRGVVPARRGDGTGAKGRGRGRVLGSENGYLVWFESGGEETKTFLVRQDRLDGHVEMVEVVVLVVFNGVQASEVARAENRIVFGVRRLALLSDLAGDELDGNGKLSDISIETAAIDERET